MSYLKSSWNGAFTGNRYETTYGSSYNKPIQNPKKLEPNKPYESSYNNSFRPPYMNTNQIVKKPNNDLITPTITSLQNPKTETIVQQEINRKMDEVQTKLESKPLSTTIHDDISYRHMVNQIARITDSLYLSGLQAITPERLKSLGITFIVSLVLDNPGIKFPQNQQMQIAIEDYEQANIRRHFDRVTERMNIEEKRNGKILVHCVAGISRSTTILLAYLMRYHNKTLRDAYMMVLAQRPYIQPNLGFWRQLIDYERSLFGKVTVNMIPHAQNQRILIPDVPPSALGQILATMSTGASNIRYVSSPASQRSFFY